jgi:hypothetical protein
MDVTAAAVAPAAEISGAGRPSARRAGTASQVQPDAKTASNR